MKGEPEKPAPPACPRCGRPVDGKARCWRCCDRACSACGRPTGSAFIELCLRCGLKGVPRGVGESRRPLHVPH